MSNTPGKITFDDQSQADRRRHHGDRRGGRPGGRIRVPRAEAGRRAGRRDRPRGAARGPARREGQGRGRGALRRQCRSGAVSQAGGLTHNTVILRSGPKERVSKDGGKLGVAAILRDAPLRDAPQDEASAKQRDLLFGGERHDRRERIARRRCGARCDRRRRRSALRPSRARAPPLRRGIATDAVSTNSKRRRDLALFMSPRSRSPPAPSPCRRRPDRAPAPAAPAR